MKELKIQTNLLIVSDEFKGRKIDVFDTLSIPIKKDDKTRLTLISEIPDMIKKEVVKAKGDAGVLINISDTQKEYIVTFDIIKFRK